MPLQRIARRTLARRVRVLAVPAEDPATARLIRELGAVWRRGEFTRAELLVMARWKSVRATPHYRRNRPAAIRAVSRAARAAASERERMEWLIRLRGVSIPVASAILTLLAPRRYGVLDIRVWQLLHAIGAVRARPDGRGFGVSHWLEFLTLIRAEARARGVTARAIEWMLFGYHQTVQTGRLYEPVARPRKSVKAPAAPTRKRGAPRTQR